jgi:hypothetical protein
MGLLPKVSFESAPTRAVEVSRKICLQLQEEKIARIPFESQALLISEIGEIEPFGM